MKSTFLFVLLIFGVSLVSCQLLFKMPIHPNVIDYRGVAYIKLKLEIRDSQNLAKLRHGCTTKLSDGGGEGIEFCFNWRFGWVATMVPNWEFRSTFWFPDASM